MKKGAFREDEASSAAVNGIIPFVSAEFPGNARSVFWETAQAGGPGRMSGTAFIVAMEEETRGRRSFGSNGEGGLGFGIG